MFAQCSHLSCASCLLISFFHFCPKYALSLRRSLNCIGFFTRIVRINLRRVKMRRFHSQLSDGWIICYCNCNLRRLEKKTNNSSEMETAYRWRLWCATVPDFIQMNGIQFQNKQNNHNKELINL